MADFQDTIKEKFNSFLSSANTLRQSATETIKEGLETGKEKLQEWDRDRRANDIYQNLGKKIYKLSNRGEIELPECCDKYIQALNELYADDEVEEAEGTEECACEDKKDCCCCEDNKECCCADDHKECCCEDNKECCCCEDKKDDDADKADDSDKEA
ncbi:MAG: hypothetical protein II767_10855 [Proteobacteria bacterium]|nr:hypothetical protein [Pseudomonadota bacterium]MBQ4360745.1 hypothetical protein [Pseudomonadota bacterium]